MKKLNYFLLVLILSFSARTELFSQVSKQDAIDFVFDSIVMNRADSVNVYMEPNILSDNYYIISPYDSIEAPFPNYWLFFVDEVPLYLWGHLCTYIFINQANGDYSTTDFNFPPINYQTELDSLSIPFNIKVDSLDFSVHYNSERAEENSHYYAVIFSGYGQSGNSTWWNQLSHMYCALREKGYPAENIYALSGDGTVGTNDDWKNPSLDLDNDGTDDIINIPCSVDNLNIVFQDLEEEMDEDDLLFIFASSHGFIEGAGTSYLALYNRERLYDYKFETMLDSIICSQMIISVFSCGSGGFVDNLMIQKHNEKRTVFAPVSTLYPNNPSFMNKYGFEVYPYFLITAIRGHFPGPKYAPWGQGDVIGTHEDDNDFDFFHDDYNPDEENGGNEDGTIQFNEVFNYTKSFDSIFYDFGIIEYDCGFQEDLLSLIGLSGKVVNSQTVDGNFLIGGQFTIEDYVTLTLSQNSSFNIVNTDITVNSSGNLTLSDETSVYGESSSSLNVIGNINVGEEVNFESKDETILEINLGYNPVNISDNCRFVSCAVNSSSDPINISYSTFDNSTFSGVNNSSGLIPYTTNLIHNTFTAEHSEQDAIYLYNYTEFNINENSINGYYNGISLNSSGSSTNINRQLNNNTINDCGMYAVNIYNSAVVLAQNHIYENIRGIGSLNRSNVNIYGNPLAQDYSEVNLIEDNSSYELYSSSESFPWYFRYNAIYDEDNQGGQTDALIYYEGSQYYADVNYNCWDNSFYPNDDLYPYAAFIYRSDYDWCPDGGGHKSTEIALDDYLEALEYFENGQYDDARTAFEDVIINYPETPYAGSAMHELFALEKYDGNDYNALKQYYMANDSIQADSTLAKLSVFLANKCEIELQNWQTAIDHYEDIIENPGTPEDSIFAIIDLGYTYLLMGDSSYKATAQGRLLEHKPASAQAFYTKRDYLLSLLPFSKSSSTSETLIGMSKQGELLQNIPNPFSNTTSIQFNLNSGEFSSVEIRVHDQVGKEVMHIPVRSAKEGSNTVELNMQGLPSGIYYYSLIVNGAQADTKKMVVVR
ncbi:MAG TPA: T9SS type A sorting domain-containing protein [Bacteroidales bacterium]